MAEKAIEGPTAGRIVHYVLPEEAHTPLEHRAAVVVTVNNPTNVNLSVFQDCEGDGPGHGQPLSWRPSVVEDPSGKTGGTWHWPERS